MPQRLRRRVTALQAFILPLASAGPSVSAESLSTIAAACRDCESLRFRYRSREGEATRRNVEPHRLVHTGRRWYLAAWDTDREDWRTFRIDRIEPGLRAGARFTPRKPPGGDFTAYVSKSVLYKNPLYHSQSDPARFHRSGGGTLAARCRNPGGHRRWLLHPAHRGVLARCAFGLAGAYRLRLRGARTGRTPRPRALARRAIRARVAMNYCLRTMVSEKPSVFSFALASATSAV